MGNHALIDELRSSGRVTEDQVHHWRNAAALMAAFEVIGRDGVTAVLKVDGGRQDAAYTVVISGPRLGEAYFRRDGNDVLSLLHDAIEFYRAEVWSKSV